MKKLIIYYAGVWAERLLTVERYKEVAYFIDDSVEVGKETILTERWGKPVLKSEVLNNEDKADIIIVISDSRKYDDAKKVLESMGFAENEHFFNGWKLTFSFYKTFYGDNSWENIEKNNTSESLSKAFGHYKRNEMMSKLIPSDVNSIMDIGCFDGELKNFLAPGIKYYGCDICNRNGDTIIYDINKDTLPDIDVDLYYMAGLIYYAKSMEYLFSQMKKGKYILLDYGGTERWLRLDGVIANDNSIIARNNFVSTDELFRILRKNGFVFENGSWDPDNGIVAWHMYLFKNLIYFDK